MQAETGRSANERSIAAVGHSPEASPMRHITFELCAETLPACLTARDGGAHRIELCSNLDVGGLTPPHSLVRAAIAHTSLPIHIMIRPRPGDFLYTAAEFATMRNEILHMKNLGAAGFVLGLLHPDATIDIPRTHALVDLAHPLPVTFHRAFDATPSLPQALEDVIATGCTRILTSGGQPNVLAGASMLANLVAQASGRIAIAAAGGLRLRNAAIVARLTQATHFHGSLRRVDPTRTTVDTNAVRALIHRLRHAV
jgi:copper homeostasis protein